MNDSFPKNKNFLFIILFLSILVSLFSCNQNIPQISNSNIYLIVDYSDKVSLPKTRLNIFSECLTDPRLLSKLEVDSVSEGFNWTVNNIYKIQNGNNMYAGYGNFVMPENMNFPKGLYNAKFVAYNGEEAPFSVHLNYKEELCSVNYNNLEAIYKSENLTKMLAVYNEKGILQYYGDMPEDLYGDNGFLSNYKKDFYFREIWKLYDYNQIIILPKIIIE